MFDQLECVLCHETSGDVTTALMAFDADGQLYYGSDVRCKDHTACRRRVELAGAAWPLADEMPAEQRRVRAVPA
jgi:hypothetical protein